MRPGRTAPTLVRSNTRSEYDVWCDEWLSKVSICELLRGGSRFRAWWVRVYPFIKDPVMFGFLYAFEEEPTLWPMQGYCLAMSLEQLMDMRRIFPRPYDVV